MTDDFYDYPIKDSLFEYEDDYYTSSSITHTRCKTCNNKENCFECSIYNN